MKYYTFLDKQGKKIVEVVAQNHDEAVKKTSQHDIDFSTDFYSENY